MFNLSELKKILKTKWGHSSFRSLQENIIGSVLECKDTLAILPTGGGKSVCYQLPALVSKGTCIVISPLIALINDQIQQLKQKDIKAVTIPGGSSTDDIIRIFDNIKIKDIKFLYLSPERLSQPLIQEKLKTLPISFFAIDEAHCISQWGHDFRPSYLNTKILKENFPKHNIIALTATATTKTQEQIIEVLQLKNVVKYVDSFARPNLAYQIFNTPNKYNLLLKILKKQNNCTIIYLQNRLAVQQLSQKLNTSGFKTAFYHAGLSKKEKDHYFKQWSTEQAPIMIATNAFGMGIDKSNVRLVIHLEIPGAIENYIQEAGRAGRDGLKAFSCTILSENDYEVFKQKTHQPVNAKFVLKTYINLNQHFNISLGELSIEKHEFNFNSFCIKYKTTPTETLKAINQLSSYNILEFNSQQNNHTLLKVIVNHKQLLNFSNHSKHKFLIDYIIRNYPGIFEIDKQINLQKTAKALNISDTYIHQTLLQLHDVDLIHYQPKIHQHSVLFKKPREDTRTINPIKKNIDELYDIEIEKNKQTLAFFNNNSKCRTQLILNYFNQKVTDTCGICDICITNNNKLTRLELKEQTLSLLKNKPLNYNQLLIGLKVNTDSLKNILNYLLNENLITEQQHTYKINE